MIAKPREADYDVELPDGGVQVTFRPTVSEFVYRQLADPVDIARARFGVTYTGRSG